MKLHQAEDAIMTVCSLSLQTDMRKSNGIKSIPPKQTYGSIPLDFAYTFGINKAKLKYILSKNKNPRVAKTKGTSEVQTIELLLHGISIIECYFKF